MVYFVLNQVGIVLICWLNAYKGLKLAWLKILYPIMNGICDGFNYTGLLSVLFLLEIKVGHYLHSPKEVSN